MKSSLLLSIILSFFHYTLVGQVSHEKWNTLLKKHVSASSGMVNYEGFKTDRESLNSYLNLLKNNHPKSSWSKNQQMAYWINAYNAFTVDLILRNYPLKSINDISKGGKKPWDIAFIKIGDKTYTLNDIEHKILRPKFQDPRIHFAVNCASISCPLLLNEAFTEQNLEEKLQQQAKRFINDKSRNKISSSSAQLSKIFEWFKGDFEKNGSIIDFLNKYSNTKITPKAKITYLNYNWNLNKQ